MFLPRIASFFGSIGLTPSSPKPLLACVSGGADSVALVHLLHIYMGELGINRLAVAHVNHGLRGAESDGDEAFVRGLSGRLGVECFCLKLDPPVNSRFFGDGYDGDGGDDGGDGDDDRRINTAINSSAAVTNAAIDTDADIDDAADTPINTDIKNLEGWARNSRYQYFLSLKRDHGFSYIATAHTANDQAETVIMRMLRGSGVRGLRGILPARGDGVVRPLLGFERGQLIEWLASRGIAYRTDSSNADTRFRRNFIRAEVIPKLAEADPAAVRNIASCAASAQRAWGIVSERVGAWVAEHALLAGDGIFHVEKSGLADEIAGEALLLLFDDHGIPPSRIHIERVIEALPMSSGEYLLPSGWKFYPRDDRICFVRDDR